MEQQVRIVHQEQELLPGALLSHDGGHQVGVLLRPGRKGNDGILAGVCHYVCIALEWA